LCHVCVLQVVELSAVGIIHALRSQSDQRSGDVIRGDDVINMATASWADPEAERVIMGGTSGRLLCVLTATVRDEGSGATSVDQEKVEDEEDEEDAGTGKDLMRRLRFTHFIFRNRMQISQRC